MTTPKIKPEAIAIYLIVFPIYKRITKNLLRDTALTLLTPLLKIEKELYLSMNGEVMEKSALQMAIVERPPSLVVNNTKKPINKREEYKLNAFMSVRGLPWLSRNLSPDTYHKIKPLLNQVKKILNDSLYAEKIKAPSIETKAVSGSYLLNIGEG